MTAIRTRKQPASGALRRPQPTWEVAHLFPTQGDWSEEEYLALNGNQLTELSNGFLEVLPTPTMSHQLLVLYLYQLVLGFTRVGDLGTVLVAALRIRLWRRKFREPDLVLMLREHADRMGEEYWNGADLVMEVVGGASEDRRRDLVIKRREYARAKIAEYWIVDPREETITVLRLSGKRYMVHGIFHKGDTATSHLLSGFTVDVSAAFSQQVNRATAVKATRKRRRPPSRDCYRNPSPQFRY